MTSIGSESRGGPGAPLLRGQTESQGCSDWRTEGSGETLERSPEPEGATREMEMYFSQGQGVVRQGVMALNWKKADLDYILGGNSLL